MSILENVTLDLIGLIGHFEGRKLSISMVQHIIDTTDERVKFNGKDENLENIISHWNDLTEEEKQTAINNATIEFANDSFSLAFDDANVEDFKNIEGILNSIDMKLSYLHQLKNVITTNNITIEKMLKK